jgi:lipoate-protein ligase A
METSLKTPSVTAPRLLDGLIVINDGEFRSAASNMAIDEALLESSVAPLLRFYRWDHPALSFGYFGRFSDVATHDDRDIVRRWTGGGVVFHDDNLTYALIIPAAHPIFRESSAAVYEATHRAIQQALLGYGVTAKLVTVAALSDRRDQTVSAVGDRPYKGQCFATPVNADVMLNEKKIAGAAQRRTRQGLLHQGSIQNVKLPVDFGMEFARLLARQFHEQSLADETLSRAVELAETKYATDHWLRKR